MLKGEELGAAIGRAIQMKLDSGAAKSKAAIARHFNMQPPSLSDWVKRGTVAKHRLPELWRYFADVAGPEHWGLTASEWPAGLTPYKQREDREKSHENPNVVLLSSNSVRDSEAAEYTPNAEQMLFGGDILERFARLTPEGKIHAKAVLMTGIAEAERMYPAQANAS